MRWSFKCGNAFNMNVLFPAAHPRSAVDLKNTRQQLIPLKWKLERFCIRTEKGGIRMRQTWQSQFLLGPTIYSRPPMARIVWFPFDQQADQSAISPLSDVPLGPSSGIRRWWTFIWISTRSEQLNFLGQNPLIYSNYYWITRPSVNVEQQLCWTSSVSTAKLLLIKK